MAKPLYQPKQLYWDKAKNTLVKVSPYDKASVLVTFVNDENQDVLTKEECEYNVNKGLWCDPPTEVKMSESQKAIELSKKVLTTPTTNDKVNKVICYIESAKKLKSGEITFISTKKELGWSQVLVELKDNKVTVDFNDLSPEKIKQILEILNNENTTS